MSKYIDVEWLKEHTEFISYTGMWHETETGEFVSRETMEEAPNIDIVRCGECKLGGTEDCPMDEIDDEYFCNFGEREGE